MGTWKFSTGEKHKQKSCSLVRALLKLAYQNQNLPTQNSEQDEVKVEWSASCSNTLEITGKSLDKKGNSRDGTRLTALLILVGEDDFKKNDMRNSIDLLKSVPSPQHKDSDSKKLNIMEEDDKLSTKSQGIRKFSLRVKGEKETLSENLKYVKECIESQYGKFQYFIEEENKNSTQNYQNLAKIFSYLDCEDQKKIFKEWVNNKNDLKNRRGVFLIRTNYENMQDWFLWSLLKHIGGCNNCQKIITQINLEAKLDFNNFWQQFAPYIELRKSENINREIVIENLTNFYKTKSIIIYIKGYQDKFLQDLLKFWTELFEKIIKLKKGNVELRKLCLIIFLLPDCQEIEPNPLGTQNYPIGLEFNGIPDKQVSEWLITQDDEDKDNIYQWDRGHEYLEEFSRHPHHLIDEICQYVFQLNNGIADIEHYWKNFA